jgi:hypothetical protein
VPALTAKPACCRARKQLNERITNIQQLLIGAGSSSISEWRILECVHISAHIIYAVLIKETLYPFVERASCLVGGVGLSKTLKLSLKRSIEHIWSPPVIRELPAIVPISRSFEAANLSLHLQRRRYPPLRFTSRHPMSAVRASKLARELPQQSGDVAKSPLRPWATLVPSAGTITLQ